MDRAERLALDWWLWRAAREQGVKCAINCDAHRLRHFAWLGLGAQLARKGWLTKEDVVNTLPLLALKQALAKQRG